MCDLNKQGDAFCKFSRICPSKINFSNRPTGALSHNAKLSMTSTDTYQLKWHSHSAHLNGSVAALLRSERFTDVVLCTMDGSQIPAHKFILSSCSVYLSSLFDGQRSVMRMGGMLYVVLPSEISTKALKILVEYMYKGMLENYSLTLAQYQS